ncbi:MAG TPA: hypothetical protein VD993_12535 [Chitinophagaceae bacterium]|nr:hypothetical protein [Chitinophagaceae bacterium]
MRKIILFVAVCTWIACSESADKNNPKAQFDMLEKVFETGNWRHTAYEDTTYLFFSREGDTHYKVYRYRMMDGDSVQSAIFNIQWQNDTILMKVDDEYRILTAVDDNSNAWSHDGAVYRFTKLDSLHLLLDNDGKSIDTLKRTLPISTFLARSKYDFVHGTNTANATGDTLGNRH